ncbi:MAG: hypothetical protein ACK56I_23975 [bacterium]
MCLHAQHKLPVITHPAVKPAQRGSRQTQGGPYEFPVPLNVSAKQFDGFCR